MNKKLLMFGATFGMLAVIIGAFGAHSLEDKITADRLASYNTGVEYQFYHTFAIFLAAGLAYFFKEKIFVRAGWFFVVGVLLFSGSIYLLSTQTILGIESFTKIIGPLTPIGGTFFIIGWVSILFGLYRKKDSEN